MTEHGVAEGSVLEVGSGKGGFLEKLLSRAGSTATAVGFDPAYVGPDTVLGGRIRSSASSSDPRRRCRPTS